MSRFENTDYKTNSLFDRSVFVMSMDRYLELEQELCKCDGTCTCDWDSGDR